MTRGQIAMEAAALIAFMSLMFTVFFYVLSTQLIDVSENRRDELVRDLSDVIVSEVSLAAGASDGYARRISLPATLRGIDYNISISNATNLSANFSEVVIKLPSTSDYVVSLSKSVEGTLCGGSNLIQKKNRNVFLTCETPASE